MAPVPLSTAPDGLLRARMEGEPVTALQQALGALGLYTREATGRFDSYTQDAVLQWQQRAGEPRTGSVTSDQLQAMIGAAGIALSGLGLMKGAFVGGGAAPTGYRLGAGDRQIGTQHRIDTGSGGQVKAGAFVGGEGDVKAGSRFHDRGAQTQKPAEHQPFVDRFRADQTKPLVARKLVESPPPVTKVVVGRGDAAAATPPKVLDVAPLSPKLTAAAAKAVSTPATTAAVKQAPPAPKLKLLTGGAAAKSATTPTAASTPTPTVTASTAPAPSVTASAAPAPSPSPAPAPSPSDYQNSPSGGGGSGSGGGGGSDGAPDTSGSYVDTAAPGADGAAPAPTQPDVTVPAVPEPTPSSGLPWGYIAAAAVILLLLADHEKKKKKPALSGPPLEELDEDEAVPEAWTAARRRSRRRRSRSRG